jgi:outer membrane cobalamin receptor
MIRKKSAWKNLPGFMCMEITLFLTKQRWHKMAQLRYVILFLISISVSNLFAQQRIQSSLKGRIMDMNGKSIESATVILNQSLSTLTDKNGEFSFDHLQPGTYEYYVSCLGFQEKRGKVAIKDGDVNLLKIQLKQLSLTLKEVTVTAQSKALGSTSVIGQDAIRYIQPKTISDMLQLLPGGITVNPTLNNLAQANIREIDGDANNALGTAIVVNGIPLSNDANLQNISATRSGSESSTNTDGMSDQTTAGKGIDLRTMSSDNIESLEVIRGIPSVEYGNLTSGVVIVKTKKGKSPLEVKMKADPFSKLAYVQKGFSVGSGTMNLGLDWSQSWADTRRHYKGYDRVTGSLEYSNVFNAIGKHPLTFDLNALFYSNINNYKKDPQMEDLQLTYKNKNIGGRLSIHGNWKIDNFFTSLDYALSAQVSHTTDTHDDWISTPDGVVTNSMVSGENIARFLEKSYFSHYQIEGVPVNLYAQVKANKYIQLGESNYSNFKLGLEYRYDGNKGKGLTFDMSAPPLSNSSQTLRPRSYKDIPGLANWSAFLEDQSSLNLGKTNLRLSAGVRISDLLLDRKKAQRGDLFVVEPRVNTEYTFLTKKNNSIFDKLSISGGFGISNKMPTLLYLYPDKAYFDNPSLSVVGSDPQSSLAIMTTQVVDRTQNPNIKPTRSTKWEIGLNARIGKMNGFVNFFHECVRNEFGFHSQLMILNYNKYQVPAGATDLTYKDHNVYYTYQGAAEKADIVAGNRLRTWGMPSNTSQTDKYGIEYSWNFGMFRPLKTSLNVDGAWFHIKRRNKDADLNFINDSYDYMSVMPAGNGTIENRVNTNFRFITHIPIIKLIFTTTLQVVWYQNERSIYQAGNGKDLYHLSEDGTRYVVSPLGFYDRKGAWTSWQPSFENDTRYQLMNNYYLLYAFKSDTVKPWTLLNFRLTKELGSIAELSFLANNFLNIKKYHIDRNTNAKVQLYPDMYFGAELKLKF